MKGEPDEDGETSTTAEELDDTGPGTTDISRKMGPKKGDKAGWITQLPRRPTSAA